jgi:hypothetical protein
VARPIYARVSDERGGAATVTVSTATADANYPVTNVQNRNPAIPFLTSSSGTAVNIDFDHGSAVDVLLVSLHGYNIPAGTAVKIQRGTTQGATTIDHAIVIPTYGADGLPMPPWADVTAASGYNGSTGFRWTRIHIPSLAQKVGVGFIGLWGAKRQDIVNVSYPARTVEVQGTATQRRTAYGGKKVKGLGVRLRSQPARFRCGGTDYTALQTLFRTCKGPLNGFLWIRDTSINDAWWASFDRDVWDETLIGVTFGTRATLELGIDEYSIGLALPTA